MRNILRTSIILIILITINACKTDYNHLVNSYNNGNASKKQKVVNKLLLLLEDERDFVKEDAIKTFGEIKDTACVIPLIELLNYNNWQVRRDAAVSLGKIKDKRAVLPLTEYLDNGENRYEYWAAMDAIINIGDSKSVSTIIMFVEESHNELLLKAINGVSKLESNATPELIEILKKNNNLNVRISIVRAFGNNKTIEAIEDLILTLHSDKEADVRKEAAVALGKIRDKGSIPSLIRALEEKNADVQQEVYNSLVSFGKDAINQIQNELTDINSNYLLIRLLGDINSEESTELIIRLLEKSDNAVIIRESIIALGKIGDKKSVKSIVKFLNHWYLKEVAVESLNKLNWKPQSKREQIYYTSSLHNYDLLNDNWETTKAIFLEDLSSSDKQDYENAIYTFIKLGNEDVLTELINKLNSSGAKHIAEIYLNCGNEKLRLASEKWAYRHGYIIEYSENETNISWGKWQRE